MKTPLKTTFHRRNHQGFALMIAVTLMAFVFLLLVSLVTLTRVELERSAAEVEQKKAQNNAILALRVALGNLQEMTGPDQRVTANAEVLSGSVNDEYLHWTGVWDTAGRDPFAVHESPSLYGWLVSGTDEDGNNLRPGANIVDPIVMVGEGSVNESEDRVTVGRYSIGDFPSGFPQGHVAYWVGDEGLKAKLNIHDYHREAPSGDRLQRRYSLMSAQRNAIEFISLDNTGTKLGNYIDPFSAAAERSLKEIISTSQYPLLGEDVALLALGRNRFHDLTTYSSGVLANVKDGGLKKDLSLAFEMSLNDFNEVDVFVSGGESTSSLNVDVNYLFRHDRFNEPRPRDTIDNPAVRGPTWHLLRNYYRLYKSDDSDRNEPYKLGNPFGVQSEGSSFKIAARPGFPQSRLTDHKPESVPEAYYHAGQDIVVNEFTQGNAVPRLTDMAIAPVVLRMQAFLSVQSVELEDEETGDIDYRIDLQMNPVVTIWNPYNIRLEFEEFQVTWRALRLGIEVNTSTNDVYRTIFSTTGATSADTAQETIVRMILKNGGGGTSVLEPGEIRVYTLQQVLTSTGGEHRVTGECYPYSGSIETQEGFRFQRVRQDTPQAEPEELLVEPNTGLAFSVHASSAVIMDAKLLRNLPQGTDEKTVSLGRIWSGTDNSFAWPSSLSGDFRLVEDIQEAILPNKHPLGIIDTHLKPALSDSPVQFLTHYNPRASSFIRKTGSGAAAGQEPNRPGNWFFGLKSFNNWQTEDLAIASDGSGFWGDDNIGSQTRVVLFELPTAPLHSLASLQHVNNVTNYAQEPAYVIGNSYASPFIPKNQLTRTIITTAGGTTGGFTQVDWSYLANDALWDQYYFSTIAPRSDLGIAEGNWGDLMEAYGNGEILPNGRMKPLVGDEFVQAVTGGGGSLAPDAYERVAGSLMLDGAFNVNSTSVEAWKALLHSTNGLDVDYLANGVLSTATDQSSPYSRASLPSGTAVEGWLGFRSLTEAEIEALAENIVEEVKARGPFASLADFVNRRLADDSTGEKGALQAAIDGTTINSSFSNLVTLGDLAGQNLQNPEHGVGPVASGASGYLRQADLLATIGPALTVRSDTFVIRAYGDSIHPITGHEVKVWCEAVVQRLPEYVDVENKAEEPLANLNVINDRFGRRFEILSFRWIDENQI